MKERGTERGGETHREREREGAGGERKRGIIGIIFP